MTNEKWTIKYSAYARRWVVYNPIVEEYYYFSSHGQALDYYNGIIYHSPIR